jgi:hypothetical protein
MKLKLGYYYFFYKLYKFFLNGPSNWLSDWKAGISMLALEIWLGISIVGYISIALKKDIFPNDRFHFSIIAPFVLLVAIKYIFFLHDDTWKEYAQMFDRWPKRKNRAGTIVVWGIVLLIVANLIFMYYLMSKTTWEK